MHEFTGTKPSLGLLADFAEGMKVSETPLLVIASFEHFPCDWLHFGEVA
jgi:hypothetical protein